MVDHVTTDLSIHKSADDYTPKLGQEVTWTITVSNHGKSWAENVRVDEMLPEGMEFVSGHASAGGFDISAGTWSIGGLNVGEEATASITMVVTDVDDYINNYATVSTDTHDCNPSNDTNTIAVDPWKPTNADLSLVKTVSDPHPEVGQVIEWTVTVSNAGPDTAWGASVKETLPDGLTFLGARSSTGAYDSQSSIWHVGHLADGESEEMVIVTRVDSEAAMLYVNTAVASSNTTDDDYSNNSADATITVTESEIEEETGTVAEEETGTVAEEETGTVAEEETGTVAEEETGTVTEEETGTVAEEEAEMVSGINGGNGHSGGNGGKGGGPRHQDMPHDHYSVPVACCCDCDRQEESGADLQIIKLVNNPTPDLNSEVVWTLMVTNNGPEDAANVVVNDNLPRGVDYVSDTTTMGDFDLAEGKWEIGDLANGESAMLQITSVATDAAAVQTNIALVSSDTEDSNAENNVATDSIDAVAADLAITKTVDEPAPNLGDEVTWTIEVVNNGPDTAETVLVSDVLPSGTSFVETDFVETDDMSFDAVTGEIQLGDIDAGGSVKFDITVTVDELAPQVNTAIVSSPTYDSDPTNNEGDATVDAVAADLELVKGVIPPATPGDAVQWTISVTNQGPDTATGVSVQDVLPDGVSLTGYTVGDETPHISFLGDSWLAADFLPGAIVDPVIGYIESVTGSLTTENFSIGGHTVAEMLVETNWRPALQDTIADTIFVDFGVNEFIAGTLPANYQSDLEELFGVLADVSPTSDVVFFIPAETAVVDPVASWSEYVDAAVAATTAAGVTAINLGDFIPAYADDPALWQDALHIGVEAADVVVQALAEGFPLPESGFDAVEGIWSVGDLAIGETATLTLEAEILDAGELVNIAQVVASDQVDPDSTVDNLVDGVPSEDDEDSATLSLIDLELTQTITDGQTEITSADVGDTVVYTITVTNESAVPATGVEVSTQLADLFSSGHLTLVEADGEFDPDSGDWVIGDLAPDAYVTLEVDAIVNTPGDLTNIAQVEHATELDVDSTPGNDDPEEDDQAVVSLEVVDPNPVPVAVSESFSVRSTIEPLNAVIMVDHSGSMGRKTSEPDLFALTGTDLTGPNGEDTSRLQLVREAIENFAEREQVVAVKVLGFDGSAGGAGNVSSWFEVAGASPDTSGIEAFVKEFEANGFTNYGQATIAAQDFFEATASGAVDEIPALASGTNYYFLTDGDPWSGGRGFVATGESAGSATSGPRPTVFEDYTLTDAEELQWQEFVDDNYNEAYGIGFGGGITNTYGLEQVAHSPGQPDVYGVEDDANSILANEADEIPAVLYSLVSESVTGTVIDENDVFGGDGPGIAPGAVTSIDIDGVVYNYSGTEVSVSNGTAASTTVIRPDSLNTPTAEGGRLDFNFSDGSFVYYAPFVQDASKTESFEYTITDGSGDIATAQLTIEVQPGDITMQDPSPLEVSSLLSDDELLFNAGSMAAVQLPEPKDNEWASDGTYYDTEFYDMLSLVV